MLRPEDINQFRSQLRGQLIEPIDMASVEVLNTEFLFRRKHMIQTSPGYVCLIDDLIDAG